MLLPFYADTLATWRTLSAALAGLGFVVFMFWHLNLHYMNILFALFGYRVFSLYPAADGSPLSGRSYHVLITPRVSVASGVSGIRAYRLERTGLFRVTPEMKPRRSGGNGSRRGIPGGEDIDAARSDAYVPVDSGVHRALREMVAATWAAMQQLTTEPPRYEPSEKHAGEEQLHLPLDEELSAPLKSLHEAVIVDPAATPRRVHG